MDASNVNIPVPRSTEAEVPAAYPVPANLTPGGLAAFNAEVAQFAMGLGAELQKLEVPARRRGERPEHTADAVDRARQAYLHQHGEGRAAASPRAARDRAILAVILLTAATVGLNVMQNFLHSNWQRAVFALFVLAGFAGLALTWAGRRAGGDK